ncbi:hypothetical protein ACIPTP_22130 [Pectobacterium versatile]|uniref:hypothetical protein n=1 Tax=Pectobacterium versatile TaxID=2488639 RepID=UPI00381F0737
MLEAIAVIGIIYLLVILLRKRRSLVESLPLMLIIGVLGFFVNSMTREFQASNQVTFYNADLQLTVGVYCLNNTVMYKVKDSLSQTDYPLQIFNDNTYGGELVSPLHCNEMTFKTEDGQTVTHNEVLRIITKNVISGYLPYNASNTANYLDRK